MPEQPTFQFTDTVQRRVLAMLLFDHKAFITNLEVVKPEYFDHPVLTDMAMLIFEFYRKYKRPPHPDEFLEEVDSRLQSPQNKIPGDVYLGIVEDVFKFGEQGEFDFVKDKVIDFARYQAAKTAIIDSVELLRTKRDYAGINRLIREAMMLGEMRDGLGSFYFENLEQRLEARRAGSERGRLAIPTGLIRLDDELGGGLAPPELGVILGATKRGKTITAVNFGAGAANMGFNVVHYAMEGTEASIQSRYDSTISGVASAELADQENEVRTAVRRFFDPSIAGREAVGRIIIKNFPPGSCSASAIEAHLQKLKLIENFEPRLVLIDYLGLMVHSNSRLKMEASTDSRSVLFGMIVKELLGMAQRHSFAIWLLHQARRSAFKKQVVDLEDTADSIEPMRDADVIITLNQTVEEERDDILRFFIAGGRSIADRRSVIFKVDKARCRLLQNMPEMPRQEEQQP